MASMSLQAAFDQARQWLESNDLNRAIGLAQYILEQYPENLDAYRILGEAYLANRQLDRAQDAFERVLRADPENIPAHVGLGITFERQGRLDRAIPEFEQALEIKPDMPELRSQLLRLYTEAWGSEHAHLRLSRAGLARLYAKGHMLPQAINEFRQVVADQPDRFDAQVAMAEALWRDGQEDAAISLCRTILAKRPESLKANLILGYLEMAGGQPEGERAWDSARKMDPYQVVARAVFDTLPPESSDEPMIDEWDEAAWRKRQAEEQERIAATRPMEAVTPVAIPVPADSSGNGSRFVPPPPPPPTPRPAPVANSDDFLANLLAINSAPPPPPPSSVEEDLDLDLDMAPFSLDDLEGSPATKPVAQQSTSASAGAPPAEEELTMAPFSLNDLGLSDDEIAGLESLNEAPAAESEAQEDVSAITPFSLSDLGLSDDEIAGLESLNEAPAAEVTPDPYATEVLPAVELEDDEPVMTPFSLSDLGLSDDEISSLESSTTVDAPAAAEIEADEPTLSPFSLSDLGLSEDEIAGLDSLDLEPSSAPERPPLGRSTPLREEPSFTPPQPSEADMDDLDTGDLPLDLQPFSLDELDLNSGSGAPSISGLGSSLQPFTFDEPPPQRPRVSGFVADEGFETSPDEPESTPDTGGFSWQQPSQKPQPGFLKSIRSEPEAVEGSIFSKLKQRHVDEGHDQRVPEPLPPMPIAEDEHLGLFSLDNVSLRDDEDLAPAVEVAPVAPPPAEPEPEPTPEQPHIGHTHAAPLDVENLHDAIEAGQVQPFSFADLGLSEEEIAAFGLADAAASAPVEPAEPVEPIASFESAAPAESPTPELSPGRGAIYTLDDLEPAEPAAFEPTPTTSDSKVESDEGLPGTGDLQPFSLTDLGLSDDEIASLGLDTGGEPEMSVGSELGITEEDLEGLGLGDLSWDQPPAAPTSPMSAAVSPEAPAAEPMQTTSGDLLVDRLIALGREQGYVDISDIIAAFEDPEAEAERIEEVGRRLHEARIEIHDGDEVIDMEAEYAEEGEEPSAEAEEQLDDLPAALPPEDEAPMTPFSLTDLGLSEDEIAALGLGESAAPSVPGPAPSPEDEPAMTPFSLTDLGLSEDEIAALGLGEPEAAPEPVTATPEPTPEEEPAMTPFSLSDLGLSEDEIAGLGLGEPVAATPEPTPEEEPAMTPFSLSDLGLSEDEIAGLGLGEPVAEPADVMDTSAVTSEPEPAAAPEAVPEEPVMTPFSLTDLGLSDAEIAALGMGEGASGTFEPEPAAAPEAVPEEPVMTPFSLTDLGLTEEEIAGLDAAETAAAPAVEEPVAPEPEPQPEPVAPPVPEPVATAPVAPSVRPASGRVADEPPDSSGNDLLDAYVRRLEADPQNHMLRLSVARAGGQLGNPDFSIQQYRYLIRNNALLDMIVDDLQDLIADADERQLQKRLHRTLGDVYTRQGRLEEAMDEYSWTPAGS
jgi:tetratricopeptide (TPR) repeat protein